MIRKVTDVFPVPFDHADQCAVGVKERTHKSQCADQGSGQGTVEQPSADPRAGNKEKYTAYASHGDAGAGGLFGQEKESRNGPLQPAGLPLPEEAWWRPSLSARWEKGCRGEPFRSAPHRPRGLPGRSFHRAAASGGWRQLRYFAEDLKEPGCRSEEEKGSEVLAHGGQASGRKAYASSGFLVFAAYRGKKRKRQVLQGSVR